ncbi:alpha/beta fold hydrolase [Pseudofrankia inefficax]|uniref:alpha/beta fold hydrolase n=1 Tax=Pseudofrankia inefficax (strain DSM 45817 / CECT 9037 / DDB 130130 / EuI1c) TaxID=298654 RepID=UPI0002DE595C|nr:alpha/beta hydrolase [Pseudofrankia inefficax]
MSAGGARIRGVRIGSGPPVLLLHGFPQSHHAWHRVWPVLAETYTVVASDLRGYGDSLAFDDDFSFRAMADDQLTVMRSLGFESFPVVGHDRGARVAQRMALDHPHAVESVVLLDIVPTAAVWSGMDAELARGYWHWSFLAQPGGLPERALAADPIGFLHGFLGIGASIGVFAPEALAEYERAALRPSVQRAFCGDYRAAAGIDLEHDANSRQARQPALVLWGARGMVGRGPDPVDVWREVFPNVHGRPLDAGHFLPEEVPVEIAREITTFLKAR